MREIKDCTVTCFPEMKIPILKFSYETEEQQYFKFEIGYDHDHYHLFVDSTLRDRCYNIDDMIIPNDAVKKVIDYIFPLSKWDIKEPMTLCADGNYLSIEYKRLSSIMLASSDFSHEAANGIIALLIDECIDRSMS